MSRFRRRQIQVSLSPEAAELIKTELTAISSTHPSFLMSFWGTNTASPGSLSPYWPAAYPGPCLPTIGQKGYFSQISPSSREIKLQSNVRGEGLTPTTPTDKWALVIRAYDTPALIKGVWIFNPGGMAIKRFSTEIGLACLAVVSSCSRPALRALPSAPYALAPLS